MTRGKGKTYPVVLLVVSSPINTGSVPEFLSLRTVILLVLGLGNSPSLRLWDTDHTRAAVGAGNDSTVEIAASGPGLFGFNLAVLDSELAFFAFRRCWVVVEVLAVVLGERAVADCTAGGEVEFEFVLEDDGVILAAEG